LAVALVLWMEVLACPRSCTAVCCSCGTQLEWRRAKDRKDSSLLRLGASLLVRSVDTAANEYCSTIGSTRVT